jgi:hypothetical protein
MGARDARPRRIERTDCGQAVIPDGGRLFKESRKSKRNSRISTGN